MAFDDSGLLKSRLLELAIDITGKDKRAMRLARRKVIQNLKAIMRLRLSV
jgi:hypothetical protein